MSIFSSSKTKYKDVFPYMTQSVKGLMGTALPGAESRLGTAGQPIDVKTAGLTGRQETAYQSLDEYLQSGLPSEDELWGMGRGEIEKTLGGEEYDPVGGQYYQAYRTAVLRELEEAKDRLAASTSAKDKYFGGGRIQTEGELEEDTMNQLALVLGQLFENERSRRLETAPLALETAITEAGMPAEKARTGIEIGDIERQLEDLGFQREYAEQVRQLTDAGLPLETALALTGYKPTMVGSTSGGEFWGALPGIAMGAGLMGFNPLQSLSGMFSNWGAPAGFENLARGL